jgi:hypothetical protein
MTEQLYKILDKEARASFGSVESRVARGSNRSGVSTS